MKRVTINCQACFQTLNAIKSKLGNAYKRYRYTGSHTLSAPENADTVSDAMGNQENRTVEGPEKDIGKKLAGKPGQGVRARGFAGVQLIDSKGCPQSIPFRGQILTVSEKGIEIGVKSALEDTIFLLKGRHVNVVVDSKDVYSALNVFVQGKIGGVKRRKNDIYSIQIMSKANNDELNAMVRQIRFQKEFKSRSALNKSDRAEGLSKVVNRKLDDTILGQLCMSKAAC